MSSHEIEDVLSSIRRLVSEDLRPVAARDVPPDPAAARGGKLILTPALRVVGAETEGADPTPRAAAASLQAAAEDVVQTAEAVAEQDAPIEEEDRSASVMFQSSRSVAKPDEPIEAATAAPESPDAIFAALVAQAGSGDGWAETADEIDNDRHIAPAHPEDTIPERADEPPMSAWPADPIVDPSQGEEAWQTGWSDDAVIAPDQTEEEPADVPVAGIATPLPAAETPIWLDAVEQETGWAETEADWVEEQPISFAAQTRRTPISPDPLAKAWADQAEAAVRAELKEKAEARIETAVDEGLFADEPGPLDEEALRELVRDIIREELAGTLGERITRNVRKLVRVEINRALAAREFE